jgi:hypothetical protein
LSACRPAQPGCGLVDDAVLCPDGGHACRLQP